MANSGEEYPKGFKEATSPLLPSPQVPVWKLVSATTEPSRVPCQAKAASAGVVSKLPDK